MENWKYSDALSDKRILNFHAIASFDEIVKKIGNEKKIIEYTIEDSTCYMHCIRHNFLLTVTPETFDLFFNSPNGYRGQYVKGKEIGDFANRQLIDALMPDLLEYAKRNPHLLTSKKNQGVESSLRSRSAKIWIHQKTSNLDEKSHKSITRIDIEHPVWCKFAQSIGEKDFNKSRAHTLKLRYKAILGLRAPVGVNLEIKGAFLKADGTEEIPINKICRAKHIKYYGFS